MDLTWGAIGKVMAAGLATYFLLPAILILRDLILWKLVEAFILNEDLRRKLKRYVQIAYDWNSKYAVQSKAQTVGDRTTYTIDGKEVSSEEWFRHFSESNQIGQELRELKFEIDRKARFLRWLLKHYQQDDSDPINDWKRKEFERLNAKNGAEKS